jgi:hypothetical protein
MTRSELRRLLVEAFRMATGNDPGLIDQRSSPLGRLRHCAAVRRRQKNNEGGAFIVGRRYLLTQEALTEELARLSQREPPAKETARSARAALEAKLKAARGG